MNDQRAPHSDQPDDASASPSERGGESAFEAQAELPSSARQPATPIRAVAQRSSVLVAMLALAMALLAAVAAGSLWWQYRQFYVTLNEADVGTDAALERVRASVREVQDRMAALQTDADAREAALQALSGRVDSLPSRLGELEQRLRALQGVSTDAREQWLRTEADYYLSLANAELGLGGHWETAIAALELADAALRELASPALTGVRELIAAELLALRSVRLPDVEGLSYSLARLAENVPQLPLRGQQPESFAAPRDSSVQEAEPGFGRLWLSFKQAVASMISFERREQPVAMALSDQERVLIQRQLSLELLTSRLALLRGQAEVFSQSIGAARNLLSREFDTGAAPVESAAQLLSGMLELDIAPQTPDISASLELLRSLPVGGN